MLCDSGLFFSDFQNVSDKQNVRHMKFFRNDAGCSSGRRTAGNGGAGAQHNAKRLNWDGIKKENPPHSDANRKQMRGWGQGSPGGVAPSLLIGDERGEIGRADGRGQQIVSKLKYRIK